MLQLHSSKTVPKKADAFHRTLFTPAEPPKQPDLGGNFDETYFRTIFGIFGSTIVTAMTTAKITGHLPSEKKELVDLLLKKANATADEVIDNAFTQFIRLNLDLLSARERERYDRYLAKKL